jgi:hypothetical protein
VIHNQVHRSLKNGVDRVVRADDVIAISTAERTC